MGLTLEASVPLWTPEHLQVVLTACPPGHGPLLWGLERIISGLQHFVSVGCSWEQQARPRALFWLPEVCHCPGPPCSESDRSPGFPPSPSHPMELSYSRCNKGGEHTAGRLVFWRMEVGLLKNTET